MVIKNYLAAINRQIKDCKVTKMYDAGAETILFMIERKDGKKMVDNVFIINSKFEIKGYPITKNAKEFMSITKRPIDFKKEE